MAGNFGEIAVQLGYTTTERVAECMKIQKEDRAAGILGEIMVSKGYLTRPQVIEILKRQASTVKDSKFIGGFRVLEELGRGATGVIFRAMQISLDREVALKVLAAKYAKSERLRDRFLQEARTVGRLRHPNIVQGIDVGVEGETYYMAMEFIDGPTIGELLRRGGALDEKRAIRIVMQIADALAYAHDNGIMHRDIKPDNIMLTGDGIAKLCDLGLARVRGDDDEKSATRRGTALGTPHYISPEQARGDENVDIRSDIYSLGATFYHMVTGTPPFPGNSAVQVIARHLSEVLESPRKRNPLVSESVERVIFRMMQKAAADRYGHPKDVMRDLKAILEGEKPPSVAGSEEERRRVGTKFRGRRLGGARRGRRISRLRRR